MRMNKMVGTAALLALAGAVSVHPRHGLHLAAETLVPELEGEVAALRGRGLRSPRVREPSVGAVRRVAWARR